MKTTAVTVRNIRVYQSDKEGKLTPVGGFKKGRAVLIDNTERKFSNCPNPVVRLLKAKAPNLFIISSPKNFTSPPAGFKYQSANGEIDDCHADGFSTEKLDMPSSTLDYQTELAFFEAAGIADMVGNPDGTFSYGDYEFRGNPDDYKLDFNFSDDQLSDETFLSADADEGFLTPAQISKLSAKGKRRYKQSLRIAKKSGKTQEQQGDGQLNKALAKKINKSADENEEPLLGVNSPANAAGGMSTEMKVGIAGGALLVLVVVGLLLSGGKKKDATATAAAPAV